MKILIISQVFWPDTASTAQHLADLAEELVQRNHVVEVISSRHAYENPSIVFPPREDNAGVKISRLKNTGLGKKNVLSRGLDFLSFNLFLSFRLMKMRRKQYDLVLGMTSPPLVSYVGVLFSRWKKMKFVYWAMDLQPELAIASGLMTKGSLMARVFTSMGNFIIKKSDRIIALDKYMKGHLLNRGAVEKQVAIVPVWSVVNKRYEGTRNQNPYRISHGFQDKIVVMYSGNHAYVHPLETLLEAILLLREDPRFVFVFVGEGVRKKSVSTFKSKHLLDSIIQFPYEPRNNIHHSLGSADLQVVILGEHQVGFTHPNKIYGAMFLGKPIVYIGPNPSHISDMLSGLHGNILVSHGEHQKLAKELAAFANEEQSSQNETGLRNLKYAEYNFNPLDLRRRMIEEVTLVDGQKKVISH